jgi:hypothetical protein
MQGPLNVKFKFEIRPRGFRVTASWKLTKLLKGPSWFSMQALHQTDFWDPASFHHVWPGLFTTISYEISFQRCCKMRSADWNLFKVLHDRASPHLLLTFRQFLKRMYPEQRMRRDGQTAWPDPSPELNPIHSYLRGSLHYFIRSTEISEVQY